MEITMNYSDIQHKSNQIIDNLGKVIIGHKDITKLVVTALLAGGNVLLEDVPGTGKTVLAKSLALSVNAKFSRVQFTPDLLPSDITGINYYNQKAAEFVFREGPVFTNILLADEINRATPRTQSSLLECMEEKQVTVDGITRTLDSPFFVIATQNPVETSGTFPLPEAQLDRFMMKLNMGFPSCDEELAIIDRFNKSNPLDTLEYVCTKEELISMKSLISNAFIHTELKKYIVNIINATRTSSNVTLGVSPRGTLAFIRSLQAYAAINGRTYVIPEDIKALAVPVLAHRLVLSSTFGSSSGAKDIITNILNSVAVPTEDFSNE